MRKRGLILLASLFLLASCGFSPIYGSRGEDGSPVSEKLSAVSIENIPNELGQKLRNRLMDRLYAHGRPSASGPRLSVVLKDTEAELGIRKDATAELSELTLQASFSLLDETGKTLLKGSASSIVLYSRLDAQYGTLAAQRNAYDRACGEIAEQIVTRLGLFYAEPPTPAKPSSKS